MMRNELQRLLLENAAFTPPPRIVAGVPSAVRTIRPPATPHSIAEELWHLVFWQDHFLRWALGEESPYPAHAELGWRTMDSLEDSAWNELTEQFQRGLTHAAGLAAQPGLATKISSLIEPGAGIGPATVLEVLMNIAVHNAYHLGRIVQLRQMLGCWPPPGDGDTW